MPSNAFRWLCTASDAFCPRARIVRALPQRSYNYAIHLHNSPYRRFGALCGQWALSKRERCLDNTQWPFSWSRRPKTNFAYCRPQCGFHMQPDERARSSFFMARNASWQCFMTSAQLHHLIIQRWSSLETLQRFVRGWRRMLFPLQESAFWSSLNFRNNLNKIQISHLQVSAIP